MQLRLFGTSKERSTPQLPILETLPLRTLTSTRFAASGLGQVLRTKSHYRTTLRLGAIADMLVKPKCLPSTKTRAQRGFLFNCYAHWWRSVWVSVDEAGGVQRLVITATTVFLTYQTVGNARLGHLRIGGCKAFSLLRFFVAV